jgi:hypothetical protein
MSRNNKVTLHVFTPWSRGHNLQPVQHNSSTKPGHPSAQSAPTSYCTALPCNKYLKPDHKNKTQNTIQQRTTTVIIGNLMGGLVERLASGGLDAGRIAWLTTRRILVSLCCFSFSIFSGALTSVRNSGEPFFIACWCFAAQAFTFISPSSTLLDLSDWAFLVCW